MSINRKSNFRYPTVKGQEYHRRSEEAFASIQKKKVDLTVFNTDRVSQRNDEDEAVRQAKRVLGVAV